MLAPLVVACLVFLALARVPRGEDRAGPSPAPAASTVPPGVPPKVSPKVSVVEVPRGTRAAWGTGLPVGSYSLDESRREPVALRIDQLGVDARVQAVAVDASGELDLPLDATLAAWYEEGAAPGESGSAVVAAHVDYGGRPGIFFRLSTLESGDRVEVRYDDGSTSTFAVAGERSYDKRSLPVDELFRRGGEPVLTLVTCGGRFDRRTRSYERNTVVTAVPVG